MTRLCDTYLLDPHTNEVLDLATSPKLALQDQIMAIPIPVTCLPPPLELVLGALSDPAKFPVGPQYSRPTI